MEYINATADVARAETAFSTTDYRNIIIDPHVTITIGGETFIASELAEVISARRNYYTDALFCRLSHLQGEVMRLNAELEALKQDHWAADLHTLLNSPQQEARI